MRLLPACFKSCAHTAAVGAGETLLRAALRCVGLHTPRQGISLRDLLDILMGQWEAQSMRMLRKYIKPGMTVVDVGANIGVYTRELSKMVGKDGLVVAFEPCQENFALLKQNTVALENVELVKAAISESSETKSLYINRWSGTLNSLVPSLESTGTVEVECFSLDDFFLNRKKPQIIKIDVEGGEPLVLRGMRRILRSDDFQAALVEYCPRNYSGTYFSPSEIFNHFIHFKAIALAEDEPHEFAAETDLLRLLNRHGYVNCWFEKE